MHYPSGIRIISPGSRWNILFSIKFLEKQDAINYTKEIGNDYFILGSTDEGDFVYEISSYGESFGITDEIIKSSFIMI
jgi:hypothetical protein